MDAVVRLIGLLVVASAVSASLTWTARPAPATANEAVGALASHTFIVNSTGDGTDANPGDGVCNDGTGHCTLRAAIVESNASVDADVIQFSIPCVAPSCTVPTIV